MGGFWKDGTWVVVVAMGVFAAIGLTMWFTYHWDFGDLCAAGENGAECFRAWFGAAAGYLAVAAAAITLLALYDQIHEQRKQTEFTVGDAPPTIDVTRDLDDPEQVVVRLVNWNRRGILVDSVEITGIPESRAGVMEYKENGQAKRLATNPYLRGWENRSGPPNTAQFKMAVTVDNTLIRQWPDSTAAEIIVRIFEEKPRFLTLRASLYVPDEGNILVA